jgi:hypothetical protein
MTAAALHRAAFDDANHTYSNGSYSRSTLERLCAALILAPGHTFADLGCATAGLWVARCDRPRGIRSQEFGLRSTEGEKGKRHLGCHQEGAHGQTGEASMNTEHIESMTRTSATTRRASSVIRVEPQAVPPIEAQSRALGSSPTRTPPRILVRSKRITARQMELIKRQMPIDHRK